MAAAAVVRAVYAEHGFTWDAGGYHADLEDVTASYLSFFVAELDGTIVGTAGLSRRGSLERLYMLSSGRGKGVGGVLLRAVIEDARKRGFVRLEIWTDKVLTDAHRLYERFGAYRSTALVVPGRSDRVGRGTGRGRRSRGTRGDRRRDRARPSHRQLRPRQRLPRPSLPWARRRRGAGAPAGRGALGAPLARAGADPGAAVERAPLRAPRRRRGPPRRRPGESRAPLNPCVGTTQALRSLRRRRSRTPCASRADDRVWHGPYDLVHDLEGTVEGAGSLSGVLVWLVNTAASAVIGLAVGLLVTVIAERIKAKNDHEGVAVAT